MGYEHVSQIKFVLKIFEKVNYLSLYRNVQRRNRFVANDKLRLQSQRSRYTNTLTLSAGKFVRITFVIMSLQAALLHYVQDVIFVICFIHEMMSLNRFTYYFADRQTGRQRRIRILEYHLNLRTNFLHFFIRESTNIVISEEYVACSYLVQSKNTSAHSGFSATGFAYYTERFASGYLKRYIVNCLKEPGGFTEKVCSYREIFF